MTTNGIYFTRFTYLLEEKKETLSKYYLIKTEPTENEYLFTEWIQLEKDFKKNNCTYIDCWIRKKNASTWSDSKLVTGLRETHFKNTFYADEKNNKGVKSLMFVQVCEELDLIIIDYFKNYYPNSFAKRMDFLNNHPFYVIPKRK